MEQQFDERRLTLVVSDSGGSDTGAVDIIVSGKAPSDADTPVSAASAAPAGAKARRGDLLFCTMGGEQMVRGLDAAIAVRDRLTLPIE